VKIDGREIVGLLPAEMRQVRGKEISMIFQDPMTALNPVYTVGWQLVEAIRAHHDISKKAALARAIEYLEMVGIPQPDQRAKSYPHEFSGGMRQRVVIAMAIANEPKVLIADEPTTALDVTVQAQILETFERIRKETDLSIILITHDLGVLAGMADRLLVMYAGRVGEAGKIDDVFDHPRMPYTVGLLGAIPGEQTLGRRLNQIKGAPPSLVRMMPGCQFAPRCPLAVDRCRVEEPQLVDAGGGQLVACHEWERLAADPKARAIFSPEAV
jgi:peptide/nickel transport system ATP-binding protein